MSLVAGLGLIPSAAVASTPATSHTVHSGTVRDANPITTTVPDTLPGAVSDWSTFALAQNTRGKATITAPTGTTIAEVKVAGSGPSVTFDIADDGRTAVNDADNAFNSSWRRILVRLHVDDASAPGSTLDDGSITITRDGATLAEGPLAVTVADPGVSRPFAFTTPANGSVAVAPDKQVRLAGEATTGTEVKVWNYVEKNRLLGSVTADREGRWEIPAELNNENRPYALHVEYTEPGAQTKELTHTITVMAAAGVEHAFEATTPAEGSRVVAPDKQVTFSGQGTTGTSVVIWNHEAKNRVVASTVVGEDGTWTVTGELDNADREYALHIEYTEPGAAAQHLTRQIVVAAQDGVARPFDVSTPAEGSTVELDNWRSEDNNGETVVSGTGQTGGKVKVWNWNGKNRIVIKNSAILTVDGNGNWSGIGEFAGNMQYGPYIEYFAPGAPLDGPPTEVVTRSFTTSAGEAVTPVTATAAFDQADPHAPAIVSGTGQDGAEIVVRNTLGDEIGRTEVHEGTYSVPVEPERATWGVNTFTAEQTAAGGASSAATTTLDYGAQPAAPEITSPEDGSESKDRTLTVTGSGAAGRLVQLADESGTLSDVTSVDGNGHWSLETNRTMTPAEHRIRAVQTGNGGLTTAATVTVEQKLLWGGLLSPRTVHEPRPEVHGIATPGAKVEFRDSLGNVYGEGTVGSDYEFRFRFTRDLKIGFTSLNLVQELDGQSTFDVIGLTYEPVTTPPSEGGSVGFTVTTPVSGSTVSSSPKSITGTAPAGSSIALVRDDEVLGTGTTNDQDCWFLYVIADLQQGRNDMRLVVTTPDGQTLEQEYSLTIGG